MESVYFECVSKHLKTRDLTRSSKIEDLNIWNDDCQGPDFFRHTSKNIWKHDTTSVYQTRGFAKIWGCFQRASLSHCLRGCLGGEERSAVETREPIYVVFLGMLKPLVQQEKMEKEHRNWIIYSILILLNQPFLIVAPPSFTCPNFYLQPFAWKNNQEWNAQLQTLVIVSLVLIIFICFFWFLPYEQTVSAISISIPKIGFEDLPHLPFRMGRSIWAAPKSRTSWLVLPSVESVVWLGLQQAVFPVCDGWN